MSFNGAPCSPASWKRTCVCVRDACTCVARSAGPYARTHDPSPFPPSTRFVRPPSYLSHPSGRPLSFGSPFRCITLLASTVCSGPSNDQRHCNFVEPRWYGAPLRSARWATKFVNRFTNELSRIDLAQSRRTYSVENVVAIGREDTGKETGGWQG